MMKYFILFFLLISSLHASEHRLGGSLIGNYGHRSDTLSQADIERLSEAQLSPGLGIMFDYVFHHHWSLEADALFLTRQYRRLDLFNVVTEKHTLLEVPMMIKFWLWQRLSIGVGPYVSYVLSDNTREQENGSSEKIELKDAGLKRFDYGGVASASLNLPIKKIRAFIESRYLIGLSDVSSIKSEERKVKEFQVLAGVYFNIPDHYLTGLL